MSNTSIKTQRLTDHVLQIRIPTPTLPPSFETNTYIIHDSGEALWVDAGTIDTKLLDEALLVVENLHITNIIGYAASHYHRDHTHGLPYLQSRIDAPIYVHQDDFTEAEREMSTTPFPHARVSQMPQSISVGQVTVDIEHAPGHTKGHVHFLVRPDNVILVGDHLAGDGSVWIGPPDGHMASYFRALDAIALSGCTIAGPGHGQALPDAAKAARTLRSRREAREAEVLSAIHNGSKSPEELVALLYHNTIPDGARLVAAKTMEAHLIHLTEQGLAKRVTLQSDAHSPRYEGTNE